MADQISRQLGLHEIRIEEKSDVELPNSLRAKLEWKI